MWATLIRCANVIHNVVMVTNTSRFYHGVGGISPMTESLYPRKRWDPSPGLKGLGTVERVDQPSFCQMRSCSEFASWRVRYGGQSVEFCSKHMLSSMRNRRLWVQK